MIVKQKQLFYFVGDQPFKTLREAQLHDLKSLVSVGENIYEGPAPNRAKMAELIAEWMLHNAAAITDILTTTPNSRARARKTNGAKKTRKSTRPVLQPANLPEA